jgi:predicted kinase
MSRLVGDEASAGNGVRRPLAVIIVTGAPGTGKTTLARRLASHYGLPLLAKDAIKESLFDSLGCGDRAWSQQLSRASVLLLYALLAELLAADVSCVIESNFWRSLGTLDLAPLVARFQFWPLQVVCHTAPDVLGERLRRRAASGERHPGHHDDTGGEASSSAAPSEEPDRYESLAIGGAVIRLDTTDLAGLDYDLLYAQIERAWQARQDSLEDVSS